VPPLAWRHSRHQTVSTASGSPVVSAVVSMVLVSGTVIVVRRRTRRRLPYVTSIQRQRHYCVNMTRTRLCLRARTLLHWPRPLCHVIISPWRHRVNCHGGQWRHHFRDLPNAPPPHSAADWRREVQVPVWTWVKVMRRCCATTSATDRYRHAVVLYYYINSQCCQTWIQDLLCLSSRSRSRLWKLGARPKLRKLPSSNIIILLYSRTVFNLLTIYKFSLYNISINANSWRLLNDLNNSLVGVNFHYFCNIFGWNFPQNLATNLHLSHLSAITVSDYLQTVFR